MTRVYRIESISQLHKAIGYPKPLHPLISVIDFSKINYDKLKLNITSSVMSGLYTIKMKNNFKGKLLYGRGHYDFEEGSLIFIGPEQLIEHNRDDELSGTEGWGIYFHPDLIRGHAIYDNIEDYSFFGYESNEALHVSEREKKSLETVKNAIEDEYSLNPDDFSMEIILSNLELLLGYCKRFYSRQFNTRKSANKDVVSEFKALLKNWYEDDSAHEAGIPTVKYFAEKLHYSPNYLGDLLKKETGKSTQDHIYAYIINKAKDLLLIPDLSITQVAYNLGFEYPQHFSRLFKNKTGQSPGEWKSSKTH